MLMASASGARYALHAHMGGSERSRLSSPGYRGLEGGVEGGDEFGVC